jgi:hypothetical protein
MIKSAYTLKSTATLLHKLGDESAAEGAHVRKNITPASENYTITRIYPWAGKVAQTILLHE